MSRVIGIRIAADRLGTLERAARALNRSPGELAGLLVEEGLRMREYTGIEFRDTPIGRQAYIAGTRLGIWQLADAARAFEGQPSAIAEAFGLARHEVGVALAYARAFPDEIRAAIDDSVALNERIAALTGSLAAPCARPIAPRAPDDQQ